MSIAPKNMLATKALMDRNARKAFEKLIKMNLIAIPGIIIPAVFGLAKHEDMSPVGLLALGSFVIASTVLFSKQLFDIVRLAAENNKIATEMPKKSFTATMMEPLEKTLPLDEKRLLEDGMKARLRLGDGMHMPSQVLSNQKDDNLTKQRLEAMAFANDTLLNPKTKAIDLAGPEHRNAVLKRLDGILAPMPSAIGLSLTKTELDILLKTVETGATTERAPETLVGYVHILGHLLESYILNSRVDSRSQSLSMALIGEAAQIEARTGISVSPPNSEWNNAQRSAEAERNKVVIQSGDALKIAKSFTALCHSAIPEVKTAAEKMSINLSGLLESERKRVSGTKEEITIREISQILAISLKRAIGAENLIKLSDLIHGFSPTKETLLFFIVHENLKSATSILRAFAKTDFGSITFEGGRAIIDAQYIAFADILACTIGVLYPHIESITIQIPESGVINLSMDAFYLQRLMKGDRGYLGRMFNTKTEYVTQTIFLNNVPLPQLTS